MTDITKFYDQATIAFEKLRIEKGDVVIVNFPPDMSTEQVHSVQLAFDHLCDMYKCNVIMIGSGLTINAISEENMNKLGWYRGTPAPDNSKSDLH